MKNHKAAYAVRAAGAPRRMNENPDFIAKLQQIEELAHALGVELGTSLARTRTQHIVLLARSLRGRLEFGGLSVLRSDAAARTTDAGSKPSPP
jgi:hypothetical protein